MPLTFNEITNGTEITVPTLSGVTAIRIPAGTPPGHIFRLSGKGLPGPSGKKRGDLHLTVQLEVPQQLSKTQQHTLEQFFAALDAGHHPQRKAYMAALRERQ